MKIKATLIASLLLAATSCGDSNTYTAADGSLVRAEAPDYITAAVDSVWARAETEGLELHSLMLVRDGKVLSEEWRNGADASSGHILNSVSKTFTSLAVGMTIAEGKLSLDDKLVDIFPEYRPDTVSAYLADMDVHDLLTMTCGHASDHTGEMRNMAKADSAFNWVKQFMSFPVEYRPGVIYCYNSVGTMMLSAIVQKRTGEKLIDFLNTRLFEPLAITDAHWDESESGICYGGWGLYLKTEDLAKTGQLILQKGEWNGLQIVPQEWIEKMTRMQVESSPAGVNLVQLAENEKYTPGPDWVQGYGYQMWMCRHNAFRADGARGQYILVMPEQNTVIAMTADIGDMQKELNLVWQYILPALNK